MRKGLNSLQAFVPIIIGIPGSYMFQNVLIFIIRLVYDAVDRENLKSNG